MKYQRDHKIFYIYHLFCCFTQSPKMKHLTKNTDHDQFSYFHTGDCRVSLYLQWVSLSPKIAPSHWGYLDPI